MPARAFIHPEDEAALEQLRSIPLFSQCLQAVMKLAPERLLHGLNMAQKVRLGPKQLPDIYKHLPVACEALGIPEPEFYLEMNPGPNAYTYGDKQPFVTVTSGLVAGLEEQEIRAVVAHECGHIACQHTLYHTMAYLLASLGPSIFGPLASLSLPVQLGLRYWTRRSELSADRAAAAVMGGPEPVLRSLVRLAGGPKEITEKIDMDLYAEQAEAYDKLAESQWDQLLQGLATMGLSHPLLSVRTREIRNWCATDEFRNIVSGDYGDVASAGDGVACPNCGRPIAATWQFCRNCGTKLQPVAADAAAAGGA